MSFADVCNRTMKKVSDIVASMPRILLGYYSYGALFIDPGVVPGRKPAVPGADQKMSRHRHRQ
jgi:hypothetical protein